MNRLRFSLRTTLTLIAVIGLLAINLWQSRRLVELERNAAKLQEEMRAYEVKMGVVEAGSADQIQVLHVEQPEKFHWHWRVRAAPETEFRLCYRFGEVGVDELASYDGMYRGTLRPAAGDVNEIDLRLVCDQLDATWYAQIRRDSSVTRHPLSPEFQQWLNGKPMAFGSTIAGELATAHHARDQPLVLLRTCGISVFDPAKPVVAQKCNLLPTPDKYGIRMWMTFGPQND